MKILLDTNIVIHGEANLPMLETSFEAIIKETQTNESIIVD